MAADLLGRVGEYTFNYNMSGPRLREQEKPMAAEWTILPVLAVIFLATLIRSAFGFGEALVAVPLLALLIPVEVAAPLAVLVSITVAVVIVLEDWHKVHFRSAWRLVLVEAGQAALGHLGHIKNVIHHAVPPPG